MKKAKNSKNARIMTTVARMADDPATESALHGGGNGKAVTCGTVSKKFYTEVDTRIRAAIEAAGMCSDDYAATRSAVDLYLSDGTVPTELHPVAVRLLFAVLRPEIDKAVERSRRARERALRKRAASSGHVMSVPDAAIGGGVAGEVAASPVAASGYDGARLSVNDDEMSRPKNITDLTNEGIERVMTMALRDVTGDEDAVYSLNRRQRRLLDRQRRRCARKK